MLVADILGALVSSYAQGKSRLSESQGPH